MIPLKAVGIAMAVLIGTTMGAAEEGGAVTGSQHEASSGTGVRPARVPVILDTDIGDDIDDTWALVMLLGLAQVDLKLIVTAVDDTETKTRLVAKILQQVGRTDIPIATGVKTSDRKINQFEWLADYDLSTYPGTVIKDGVQATIDLVKSAPKPVTILVIGPQTNLKEALRRDPSIAANARIVAMAGSVAIGYEGKNEPDAEYNVARDVEAARAVFAAPWEITIAPLDVCGTLVLSGDRYNTVKTSQSPRARTVIENYDLWTHRKKHPEDASSVLYDTVAACLTFDDGLCWMETVKLTIDDKGRTVPAETGRPVRCALKWNDRDVFEQLLVATLTGS
jgi:inosine-uridine nucleoside N-ribohydrolase